MGTIKDYRNMVEQPWGKMFYDLIYKQLIIPNDNINKVLDFGAGFCITADHYAKNHDVTAVEPSEEMRELRVNTCNYTLVPGGIDYLQSIGDNTFDVVICHNVLEYVDDMSGVLAQLIRVLKPGGILSIVKHNEYGKAFAYAVLNDNPAAALDVLDKYTEESAFGSRNVYSNEYLADFFADDAELKDVFGIRTLFGLSSNNEIKFNEEWYSNMLELETKAGAIDEYKKVAFYNHLVFRKK
ncbi:class I SAM-dependent methyltransferase [Butyrivibrio sp. JL13D10]|uniref:class I SAM-dependent methyltransferase n=1 Tax=Butyrivibrio sp. JL13D10 TaxID=3236815 RepID=UPI0038B4476C